MAKTTTATQRWNELDNGRSSFLSRCENYARYTIPKICPPKGTTQNNNELAHDYQSVGAQAVNHLSNKLMLALFAPSRPFFRLDPDDKTKKQLAEIGVSEAQLSEVLSVGERKAVAALEQKGARPKLYESLKHLIITGNAMIELEEAGNKAVRVMGLRHYCVKRSVSGQLLELLIREKVKFDELEPDVQEALPSKYQNDNYCDKDVEFFRWVRRNKEGDFLLTQWVDTEQLPEKFEGKWPEDKLPYRVLTWDLADEADYGTGLVEDYAGDFAAISILSESQVKAAVLASEFRYLVNPGGITRVEDMETSENGSVLPGTRDDITILESSKGRDAQTVQALNSEYIQRIGRGFLMGSAVTRQAERVTAEEIRLQANELESSLGGVYSRLAVDFQLPMAYWLLALVDLAVKGTALKPTIVTGLDALSRSGDLENMKLFLGDVNSMAQFPPLILSRLKIDSIMQDLAAARGIMSSKYVMNEQEFAQQQQAAQQAQASQVGAEAAAKATGEQAAAAQPQPGV